MIFGQVASPAMLFEKFHAGARNSHSGPHLLEQPKTLVLILFLAVFKVHMPPTLKFLLKIV